MTELRIEILSLPGAPLGPLNPLPYFRDKKVNLNVPVRDSVDLEKRSYFGYSSGKRTLPYRMQDQYTRNRAPYSMRVAILENDFLKATFWLELGCRLMSLVYKPLQRELLFNNPVFQPANLALRNAWFSGGIEWNVGQLGHTFFTCSPLFVAQIEGSDGEPGLRIYEYERCKNIFWHTDFYLPADSEFLTAFTRVINAREEETSLYWWTNIAVPEAPDVRVLAPTSQAVYIDREIRGFGQAQLPYLPTYGGKDSTYPVNSPNANEFFFQCQEADVPWESALDASGQGLVEASTRPLSARKLFCWGMHQGGRHWQEFLSLPGLAYAEIQGGLAPTQLHSLPFEGGGRRWWTQVFGYIQADPGQVHGPDWETAWRAVDSVLKSRMDAGRLAEIEADCLARADRPSHQLVQQGSGWGALELARRSVQGARFDVPETFVFPLESMGKEQQKWLDLLEKGFLAEQPSDQIPGEWMVQPEWRDLLNQSLQTARNRNWYALLHAGVMEAESLNDSARNSYSAAQAAWEESLTMQPSIWAYRNLAVLARSAGKTAEALAIYQKANLQGMRSQMPAAMAQEYLSLLVEAGEYARAWEVCEDLSPQALDYDPVQILRASIALQVGRLEEAEASLMREYASIREGAVVLTDLWVELWRRRMSAQSGRAPQDITRQEVEAAYPPPAGIDFRSAQ